MTTPINFHEIQDRAVWAKVWKQGPGSRHEMFGKLGIKCRKFRVLDNPDATGLMLDMPEMAKLKRLLPFEERTRAMREGGLNVETMRMLVELTP